TSLKNITGKVTNLNAALADVNIVIKNRNIGTKTNAKGAYVIQVKIGDQIQYSYVGFKTITIAVEDITSVLNINMITENNLLEETIVQADKSPSRVLELAIKKQKIIKTSRGTFNPEAFNVKYMDGKNIDFRYSSLAKAIAYRFSGVSIVTINFIDYIYVRGAKAVWEVDGAVYDIEPPIDLSQIKDISIPMSNGAFVRWGGPVVIVRTKYGSPENKEALKKEIAEKYTNKNYYNDDAVAFSDSNISANNHSSLKEISGTVKNLDKPLANVNITINNKNKNLKSNVQGNYNIKANIGDLIQFRYMGFKTVTIIVEDITSVLNINMVTEVIKLDETVLATNNYEGKTLKNEKKKKRKFLSARGTINPDRAGYSVGYFDGINLNNVYGSLTQALVGRVSGYYIKDGKPYLRGTKTPILSAPAIWEVDGIVSTDEPYLDLSQIKDIHFLKSLASTNRYGSAGMGGVIVVSTKYGSFSDTKNKKQNTADKYTNKNIYTDDAVSLDINSNYNNEDIDSLIAIKIKTKAFAYYQNSLKHTIKDYNVQIDLAKAFKNYYKDLNLVSQILMDIAYSHNKNSEILKAVAFQMQAYGLKNEVIKVYERIFKLRPHYAQSYRDLANAYKDDEQFNKSWKLYMSYLLQGNDVENEGIGQILYSEMEWLYFNEKNQALKNIQFVPKSKSIKDFKNDVRLVFEWNTSEAEFDLEFVNPNKQVYNFEHSLVKDPQLISDEKRKGYSSKEFIIDNLNDGKWLVNITYLGNKKPEPTYIKVTVYNHWGNTNQQEKISVYKLDKEHTKLKLYNIDNRSLIMVSK
ncbi:MAG: carboxypeptidase-like regulatory domain-containing protein, partial [Flavobacteriaceae bacterium]|nr:carboxypeptidase-like regulatory domain-containing protein [Flavobacteriaceae bacterium]